jgi:hypothetical protein
MRIIPEWQDYDNEIKALQERVMGSFKAHPASTAEMGGDSVSSPGNHQLVH